MNTLRHCKLCKSNCTKAFEIDSYRVNSKENPFPLGKSSVLVSYYCCQKCFCIQTFHYDKYTAVEWSDTLYNDEYKNIIDQDYKQKRPTNQARLINNLYLKLPNIFYGNLLDYGGGSGLMSDLLLRLNINSVSYDPFDKSSNEFQELTKFDVVTAFEVVEHSVDPMSTFADIVNKAGDHGMIIFTTAISDLKNENWLYAAPRNGHVTLYSRASLQFIANRFKKKLFSVGSVHMLFNELPSIYQRFKLFNVITIVKIVNRINEKLKYLKP